VKFTPQGSVTITAEEQRGGVEIRVADTGIGIPVEVQAFMFEPFRQAEVGEMKNPRFIHQNV